MSERREFNAPTVEEALEKATSSLDTERSRLSYEILDEGSSGFLGLGARDARVSVGVPAVEEEPPEEGSSPAEEPDLTSLSGEEPDAEAPREAPDENAEYVQESKGLQEESVSGELLEKVREHIEACLDAMAFDGEISVRDHGEILVADISSGDAGLVIGQKGETIDALQYLVNIAVYRDQSFAKKIVLDCEGYRERRVNAVQGMAHRTARRVVREGKPADLPPMSSSERKAVHAYLKDDPRTTTSSTGNDENRRVKISPAQE